MSGRAISIVARLGLATSTFTLAHPALCQTEPDDNAAGSDIIVTARRTEERLQDVPISITVFTQDQISKRNIITASDLAAYTPSLSVNQRYGAEKSSFAIRGFIQEQATAPSVGVYFADVTVPRSQGGTTSGNTAPVGSFVDLENVQVLKGPQGTLFGRNTTGGAVLLVPKKPTDRLEGYAEGSVGDYGMKRGVGVLNVPLSDTFRIRAMVDRNHRDGYMHNHSGIGPDNYNDVDYFAARLGILAEMTPDLENYTVATYSNSFAHGYAPRIVECQRNSPPGTLTGLKLITAGSACDQLARQAARGDGTYDVEVDASHPFVKLQNWSVINTTTWKASDTLTIKNIASYSEFTERSSFSLGGDNFFIPAGSAGAGTKYQVTIVDTPDNQDYSNTGAFTEELQFQGQSGDGKLNWQAGGYMEISSPLDWAVGYSGVRLNCSDAGKLLCTNPLVSGSVATTRTKNYFSSYGLYAQGTYNFTDKLALTGGIRYTWDRLRAVGESTRVLYAANNSTTRVCNDAYRFPGATVGVGKTVTSSEQCHNEINSNSQRPTWLIDLDYKPIRDILIYAKWARGYRQGGISLGNIGVESWGPEKVDTYEVGAKAGFRGGSVSGYFNIAAFYNDFRDQQISASLLPKPTARVSGAAAIINAGKSRIQGVEVDASATLFDSLKFDLGYTYLDTKLIDIVVPTLPDASPFGTIIPSAVKGAALGLSPKNRVSLTGTYTVPLDKSIGKISFGATYVHTDSQIGSLATLVKYQKLPATDLVNLNVDWHGIMGTDVDAGFFVTNLTNQTYPIAVTQNYTTNGFESLMYGAPRMFGFRLRYSFGD